MPGIWTKPVLSATVTLTLPFWVTSHTRTNIKHMFMPKYRV